MTKFIDLTGNRFGRLTVLSFDSFAVNHNGKWLCVCDCGKNKIVYSNNLRRGLSLSCGCLNKERTSQSSMTHGQSKPKQWTPEYSIWAGMIQRCTNACARNYADYQGRGIAVCDRWRSFENFFSDMGKRPTENHSLDRINNDGNYEPGNCRWATRLQQAQNKRSNHIVIVNGEKLVFAEACRRYNVGASKASRRLKRGWSHDETFNTPHHLVHLPLVAQLR